MQKYPILSIIFNGEDISYKPIIYRLGLTRPLNKTSYDKLSF